MGTDFSSEWIHKEKRRYYHAWVQQDLFSDWILCCRWGSLDSARGGQKTLICHSKELGATLLQKMEKRRTSRGYCDLQSSVVQTNENPAYARNPAAMSLLEKRLI